MSTTKTDKLVARLRYLCKAAGFSVKSDRQIKLAEAEKSIKRAQARIIANNLIKCAKIRKQIKNLQKKA